jgi:carbon-monoxide dehydrogenase large subunit
MADRDRRIAVGSPTPRRTLDRFVAGKGRYLADLPLPGALVVRIVRSPLPHAEILSIDTSAARAISGVAAILTGADLAAVAEQPSLWDLPGQNYSRLKALAIDRLLWVGQPYAVVAAIDADTADAAAAAIVLDARPLPFHLTVDAALAPDAVRLYDHWPDNVVASQHWPVGDIDAAFAQAAHRVTDRFVTQRVHALSLEPRGIAAQPDGEGVVIWCSTQSIHQVRAGIAGCLDLPEHRIRVIAPDIGGAFGMKGCAYGEETLLALLALRLQRPVRWVETRRESFVGSTHGRDTRVDLDVAFDAEGGILGLRGDIVLDKGGDPYATSIGTAWITGAQLTGPYRVPAVDIRTCGVVTNKVPTGAYRGFGQPEATFAVERLLDMAARRIGITPAEIRRRNLVTPQEMPFTVHSGLVLDSGRYADLLDATLDRFGYDTACARAEASRTATRATGIGIACHSENTNFGPSPICKLIGINNGGFDTSIVRMEPSGHIRLFIGQTPMGQGIETSMGQLCADALTIPVEDVSVVHGDTLSAPYTGYASGGSRGAGVGGMSVTLAAQRMADRLCRWGAHLLGAEIDEVELKQGGVQVARDPVRRASIATIAHEAYRGASVPAGLEPGLEDRAAYDPPATAISYGSVAVEVTVDLELGKIRVDRITFGHDCGVQINPPIVDGQVRGGVAQGIGATLFETIRYDDSGQPLTLSLHDYLLPLASDVPPVDLLHFETPTPFTPIGVKGVGESGVIPIPAAIANAVRHALGHGAAELNCLPLTPETVLNALAPRLFDGGFAVEAALGDLATD